MARVGGSIGWAGIGSSTVRSHSVSATVAVFQPGDGDDVAGFGALHRHARQAAEGQQLGDAGLLDHLAVAVQRLDVAVDGDDAGFDAAGQDAAQEVVGLQRGDQHLEGMLVARQRLRLGRRHVFDDALEQRRRDPCARLPAHSPPSRCGPRRRDDGSRADRRWLPAPGTDRRWIPAFPWAGRRSGRSC